MHRVANKRNCRHCSGGGYAQRANRLADKSVYKKWMTRPKAWWRTGFSDDNTWRKDSSPSSSPCLGTWKYELPCLSVPTSMPALPLNAFFTVWTAERSRETRLLPLIAFCLTDGAATPCSRSYRQMAKGEDRASWALRCCFRVHCYGTHTDVHPQAGFDAVQNYRDSRCFSGVVKTLPKDFCSINASLE